MNRRVSRDCEGNFTEERISTRRKKTWQQHESNKKYSRRISEFRRETNRNVLFSENNFPTSSSSVGDSHTAIELKICINVLHHPLNRIGLRYFFQL